MGVYLTKGQPDQSSNTLGHKMSLMGVHLPRGQPNGSSNTLGHKMSLGEHLTKGQSDLKI